MTKNWLITGASSGFGAEWARAALERGDRVAGTARDASRLRALSEDHGDAFVALELDVTDRDAVFAAVGQAADRLGRLDVVVNNAGFGHFGMVEELTEDEVRAVLETNLFGALWVTQAVLPVLRAQRSGHIVQVTSEGGVIAYPGFGAYHAAKWGLEGITQSLVQEVAGLGVDVTLVEPGPFATGFSGAIARSEELGAYDAIRAAVGSGWEFGDVAATRAAILEVVDAQTPPLRVFLGRGPFERATADYAERLETWARWREVSEAAGGPVTSPGS